MATRGQQKKSNATLSKEKLTELEKKAERSSRVKPGEGRGLKEYLKRKAETEKKKKEPVKGKRRSKVQARRTAEKNIPKRVRDMMVSEKQDKQNKGDTKLRTEDRSSRNTRGRQKPAPKGTLSNVTDATARTGSRVGAGTRALTGLGALLYSAEVGRGSDVVPAGRRDEFVKKMDAERVAKQKAQGRGRGDGNAEVATRRAEAAKKKKTEAPATKSDAPSGPPRTIAEAKRRGLDYFVGKDGKRKAAVTAEELKASGMSLRDYLNKKQGKTRKMASGGMVKANCGASMKPTQKSSKGIK